jgi:hypothetical protein
MGLADELTKLDSLRKSGVLSEAEFQVAKTKLLNEAPVERSAVEMPPEEERFSERIRHSDVFRELPRDDDESLGKAANRYVSYQMVMGVIGLIVFLIFFLGVILPNVNRSPFSSPSSEIIVKPSHSGVPLPSDWKR